MTTYTRNYNFEKIDFNLVPWDTKEHNNWDLLDQILSTIFLLPNVKGIWQNSTAYAVGDTTLDAATLEWYTCKVANTSSPSGTFAAERVAHPTYWEVNVSTIGAVRFDVTQALTSGQKTQANTNIGSLPTAGGAVTGAVSIAGNLYANGGVSTGSVALDSQYVLTTSAGYPHILFDNGDYLNYDRVNNVFSLVESVAVQFQVWPTNAVIVPPTLIEGRRVCGPQELVTASAATTMPTDTSYTSLCFLQFTASGTRTFVNCAARIANSGNPCDVAYLARINNMTTGNLTIQETTRYVTCPGGTGGAAVTHPLLALTVPGQVYQILFYGRRYTNNGVNMIADDLRIDGVNW